MPLYAYRCPECDAEFDVEAPVAEAWQSRPCPACGAEGQRMISSPRLMFKADPRDNRPYWHNHDGYSHSHAPRRGRHAKPEDDH
jgi:putative FmdB family regulatory protein